ncbi:MAG: ORF6N domain-containing protein [Dysgonomonas sp.]
MELQIVQNRIYEIRGLKVMLDYDLAELYEVETRALNQAVKRNMKQFPIDFMFQLNEEEAEILKSQFVTSSWGGTRKLPFAFTEHGVTMLASILRSDKAIEVNIQIVRAFIILRQYALGYAELNQKLENFMLETNLQFNDIYQALTELASPKERENKPHKRVGFVKDK